MCGNNLDMKKSKWTAAQVRLLLQKTEGSCARMHAFKEVAQKTGRKTNSVRNYYYKFHAKKKQQVIPFEKAETAALLREIILGTSRGESVRSVCLKVANNDKAKMLRLQNKYRSVLAKNPEQIDKTVKSLEAQGFLVKNPIIAQATGTRQAIVSNQALKANQETGARIIKMPEQANGSRLTDTDINNLFMGLVRMIQKSASDERIESLKAEIERLRTKVKDLAK